MIPVNTRAMPSSQLNNCLGKYSPRDISVDYRRHSLFLSKYGSLETAMEKEESFRTVRSVFPIVGGPSKCVDVSLKLKLLLSAKQLMMENYPLPLEGYAGTTKNYISTKEQYKEVSQIQPQYVRSISIIGMRI